MDQLQDINLVTLEEAILQDINLVTLEEAILQDIHLVTLEDIHAQQLLTEDHTTQEHSILVHTFT